MSSIWRSILGFMAVILGLSAFLAIIGLLGAVVFMAI